MKHDIHGDKLVVTDAIREYVREKLGKLDKYFENNDSITSRVVLRVKGRDQTVEVTIPAKQFTLRNEVSDEDMYAAIDKIVDKLERQIRKNKTKIHNRIMKNEFKEFSTREMDEIENSPEHIVKRKQVEMKPMDEEEAILQMDLVGHDFYIYKDANTNLVCVVYKRKDGNYGLIETI